MTRRLVVSLSVVLQSIEAVLHSVLLLLRPRHGRLTRLSGRDITGGVVPPSRRFGGRAQGQLPWKASSLILGQTLLRGTVAMSVGVELQDVISS